MRVAKYYNNHDIRIEDYPIPKIGPGEILVKVFASGICGTDVMEWYRTRHTPRILGHEITGEVVESRSEKWKTGVRVFVSHHVPCNICKYCLAGNHTACETLHKGNYDPGGYSEFVRVPKINAEYGVYALPDNVSYTQGTLIEPLACVVRGQRVIGVNEAHTVLILGSGVSGLLNIQYAILRRARVIATDIDKYRLQKAKECGADKACFANQIPDIKAERAIVSTGAPEAVKQAFEYIDRKGIVLLFAVPNRNIEIPTVDFWRNEMTITSSYGAAPSDLKEALDLIKDSKIKVKDMITHELPLEDIQEGFRIAIDAKESLKVVIQP